jgi:hypothetical protein
MSHMNTLLFGVPAVVLLLLPLLCFAVGCWLQDRFDFTLPAGSNFFIGDRLREGADHLNRPIAHASGWRCQRRGKRESQHHVSGCETSCTRLRRPAWCTTAYRTAGHRKLDRISISRVFS